MDFEKYPMMVSGVDTCVNYASKDQNGQQVVKSTCARAACAQRTVALAPFPPWPAAPLRADEISALHMKFKYYVTHTYAPR